jgi:D-alanine transaminase
VDGEPQELLYLNGDYQSLASGRIGVEDRGFQLGDGVYEVVQVFGGRLIWLDEHLERLATSLGHILVDGVLQRHDLSAVLPRLVQESGLMEGFVYVQVTRGPAARDFAFPTEPMPTVLAYTREAPFPDEAAVLKGTSAHPVKDFRWGRCDIKSTNLLAAVLGKAEARDAGADEVVWIGPGPLVREGGSSNITVVLDGVLRTHPADRWVLDGITRRKVLAFGEELGVPAVQAAVKLAELQAADEVFLSSTLLGVMPVLRVGGHEVGDGRPGPVTLRLAQRLREELVRLSR